MARMRTFLIYALLIIGFIFFSYIIENGLIENMYVKLGGNGVSSAYGVDIEDASGKASSTNGYLNFKVTDKSADGTNKYIKIDLYSKQGNHVATKYVPITDLDENNQKSYQVKINGQDIRNYEISVVDEEHMPDRSSVISVLGYEIDLADIWGHDFSNISVFGKRIADVFNVNNVNKVKNGATTLWGRAKLFLADIPWWGYAIATGIVLWYMPARYLFGVFPI